MRTKYVLIERGPEFKRTAVSLTVAQDIERRGKGMIGATVTLKQIKAERLHIYQDEHYFRHMAECDYQDTYETGTVFNAKVIYFDRSRGEGMIRVADGSEHGFSWMIYACNLPGRKTWYPETACTYYESGTEIQITFEHKLAVSYTPALIDTKKWNSLDQSKLAFRCNEEGEAVTGLFASKGE